MSFTIFLRSPHADGKTKKSIVFVRFAGSERSEVSIDKERIKLLLNEPDEADSRVDVSYHL